MITREQMEDAAVLPLDDWNRAIDAAIEKRLQSGKSAGLKALQQVVVDAAKALGLGVLKKGVVRLAPPYLPPRGEAGHWTFNAIRAKQRIAAEHDRQREEFVRTRSVLGRVGG